MAVCTEFSVLETHRARKSTRGSSAPGGEGEDGGSRHPHPTLRLWILQDQRTDNLPTWGTAPGAPGPAVSPPAPRFPASPGPAERALPTTGDGFPKPRRELPGPSPGDPRRTRRRRPTGAGPARRPRGLAPPRGDPLAPTPPGAPRDTPPRRPGLGRPPRPTPGAPRARPSPDAGRERGSARVTGRRRAAGPWAARRGGRLLPPPPPLRRLPACEPRGGRGRRSRLAAAAARARDPLPPARAPSARLLPPPCARLLLLPRAPGGAGETERRPRGRVAGSRGSEPRTPSRDRVSRGGGARAAPGAAPTEPARRADRGPGGAGGTGAGRWGRRERRFVSGSRDRPPQKWKKSCAWKDALLGSRREPSVLAAGGVLRPARVPGAADCGLGARGRPVVARAGLDCGVWVKPAADVSCCSDLGCIFVGSAGIGGEGWRRGEGGGRGGGRPHLGGLG